MEYNKRLLELYDSKKEDLVSLFKTLIESENDADHNFSWPMLLRIFNKEYDKAPVKIMFFGQETYGWDNTKETEIRDNNALTLTEEYVGHQLGRHRIGHSAFFRTIHELSRLIGNPDTNCFVWNNILKFGKEDSYGAPSEGVLKAEMEYLNIIPKEVEILNPEVCVFLTGPNYDVDIKNRFPDVEFMPIEGFKTAELVRVKSQGLPEKSFRTYHPGYGYRHKDLYDKILHTIVKLSKK